MLRFLNLRYPRDYNTVPRLYFWLFHLVWLFPWSVYLPAAVRLSYKPVDRAGRARLLALVLGRISAGVLHVFDDAGILFDAVLSGAGAADRLRDGQRGKMGAVRNKGSVGDVRRGRGDLAAILIRVRGVPAPGDISSALTQHPAAYTLSLGHMEDLTLESFAYLRIPLVVAGAAFLVGAFGAWRCAGKRAFLALL